MAPMLGVLPAAGIAAGGAASTRSPSRPAGCGPGIDDAGDRALSISGLASCDRLSARRALGWRGRARILVSGRPGGSFEGGEQAHRTVRCHGRGATDIPDAFAATVLIGQPSAMSAADVAVRRPAMRAPVVVVRRSPGRRLSRWLSASCPGYHPGLPGCAITDADPDALAGAAAAAISTGGDPVLRRSMEVYGRRVIAERVVSVYRRALARRCVR
jgi:hypothetical protein